MVSLPDSFPLNVRIYLVIVGKPEAYARVWLIVGGSHGRGVHHVAVVDTAPGLLVVDVDQTTRILRKRCPPCSLVVAG